MTCPFHPDELRAYAVTEADADTRDRLVRLADWLADDRRRRRDMFAAELFARCAYEWDGHADAEMVEWSTAIWQIVDIMLAAEPLLEGK